MSEVVTHLLVCECSSSEHQLIFKYFKGEEHEEVYVDVHLTKKSFWNRILHGIKYIFGHQSKYGAFDEVLLGVEHISTLESVVNRLKQIEADRLQLKLFNDDGTRGTNS